VKTEEVTQQILSAWEEMEGPKEEDTEEGQPEPEVTETPAEEPEIEAPEEDTGGDTEEPETDEDEEPVEAEAPDLETATVTLSNDPLFRSWLARYQGDVQRALEGAYQLERAMGRQGQEKAVLTRRVQELESQLYELQAFAPQDQVLSQEQRDWTNEAMESGNPAAYVREAIKAGEFGLARAVCSTWGQENAFEALRASQLVDAAEANWFASQSQAYEEEALGPVDHGVLLNVLVQNFPEMPQYEAQMVQTLQKLGEYHPVVQEARSSDPAQAARGLITLYEIARASAASLATAREQAKNGSRAAIDEQRRRAVVSSAGASPAPSEAPRAGRLGPGLTLDQLDAEWAAHS